MTTGRSILRFTAQHNGGLLTPEDFASTDSKRVAQFVVDCWMTDRLRVTPIEPGVSDITPPYYVEEGHRGYAGRRFSLAANLGVSDLEVTETIGGLATQTWRLPESLSAVVFGPPGPQEEFDSYRGLRNRVVQDVFVVPRLLDSAQYGS